MQRIMIVSVLVVALAAQSACAANSGTPQERHAVEVLDDATEACAKPRASCIDHDFTGLDLSGRDFSGADLSGSKFDGANLSDATFAGTTLLGTSWRPAPCLIPMPSGCTQSWGWDVLSDASRLTVEQTLGTVEGGYSPDGIVAAGLTFTGPQAVDISADGSTLFVADTGNRRIRSVNLSDGTVATIAGSGSECVFDVTRCNDGGAGTTVPLTEPAGLALDPVNERLFIADAGAKANLIWQLDLSTRNMHVVAGKGLKETPAQGAGKPGADVGFAGPRGLAVSGSKLYVADSENNAIRAMDVSTLALDGSTSAGEVTLVAGSPAGKPCPDLGEYPCGQTGPAVNTLLRHPMDIASQPDGGLLVADTEDGAIRRIGPDGMIRTVVSGEAERPTFVSVSREGDAYVGPFGAGTAQIGRVGVDDLASGLESQWTEVSSVGSVAQIGSGLAVSPTSRLVAVTRPASNQVDVLMPRGGPNISGADFKGANLGPSVSGSSRTTMEGLVRNDADFSGSTLDFVEIRDSVFPALNGVSMQDSVIYDSEIGDVVSADLSRSAFGQVRGHPSIKASCLRDVRLSHAEYDQWSVEDSVMSGLQARGPDPAVKLTGWTVTNADFSDGDSQGRWTFAGGKLRKVNFEPGTSGGQFVFAGTSLSNVPTVKVTKNSNQPDYSKKPTGWDSAIVNASCTATVEQATPPATVTIDTGQIRYDDQEGGSLDIWFTTTLNTNDKGVVVGGRIQMRTSGEAVFLLARPFDYAIRFEPSGTPIATGRVNGETGREWQAGGGSSLDITPAIQARSGPQLAKTRVVGGTRVAVEITGIITLFFDPEELPPFVKLAEGAGTFSVSAG